MQTNHLKKRTTVDILSTLKAFKPHESELILYSDSQTTTATFSSRYQTLKKQGVLNATFTFLNSENPKGTIIVRKA